MTAKSQPMADPTDDLIAELAKLMAQDAKSDDPQGQGNGIQPKPVSQSAVRIPGNEAAATLAARTPVGAVPRFDFSRVNNAAGQAAPAPRPSASTPQHSAQQAATNFDSIAASRPVESVTSPKVSEVSPSGRDGIADLIAADMSEPVELPPTAKPAMQDQGLALKADQKQDANAEWAPASAAPHNTPPEVSSGGSSTSVQAEDDQFRTPPVFGLNDPDSAARIAAPPEPAAEAKTNRAPEANRQDVDPIDEMESLIGKAVRINLDAPKSVPAPPPVLSAEKQGASPALRSLATPTLPRKPEVATNAADKAVLAAAEASGAQIGWVDTPEIDESELLHSSKRAKPKKARQRKERSERSGGLGRAFVGPLVAASLLVLAGGGLYWVLGQQGEAGPAPLLVADASPTKQVPEAQPEAAATAQSVVFNEMDGVVPGAEEQLVSRDQADVQEVTQVASVPEVNQEGLVNRKVRTVTVRPDGTIVSGDESVAGSAMLPVDRPNVPEIPEANTDEPSLLASTDASQLETAPSAQAENLPPEVAPEQVASIPASVVAPGATVPVVDASGNPVVGKTAVIPLLRPETFSQAALAATASQPTSSVNAVVGAGNIPSLPPAPSQTATTPGQGASLQAREVESLGNTAPAYVQLASQRSEADARQTADALVRRYGPLFGGANLEVQRIDLAEKGVFYRVRVPAQSREQASNICTNVKAAGGDCFTF